MEAIQTKQAQPMGIYRPTSIDARKRAAEFRIVAVGKRTNIIWKDGRAELVTDSRLAKLQSSHAWATDF